LFFITVELDTYTELAYSILDEADLISPIFVDANAHFVQPW